MKFGGDWTGVFIRGDDALSYALSLQALLDAPGPADEASTPTLAKIVLRGLIDALRSCNEGATLPQSETEVFMVAGKPAPNTSAQNLKEFDECLSNSE